MTSDRRATRIHANYATLVLLCTAAFTGTALAGEKPPLLPDEPSALTTTSRVSDCRRSRRRSSATFRGGLQPSTSVSAA
jgi:hypothetical protein